MTSGRTRCDLRRWTADEVQSFRALWRAGWTCDEIARTACQAPGNTVRMMLYGDSYHEIPGAITRQERRARYGRPVR